VEETLAVEAHKQRMIRRALAEHREVYPCADRTDLWDCFTSEKNRLMFWFNTRDASTHMLSDHV
jgi:hypothetical protein